MTSTPAKTPDLPELQRMIARYAPVDLRAGTSKLSPQDSQALAKLIWPLGKWRMAVRGLAASNLRSTIRLKAIAHVRAQTIAARINRKIRQPGHPLFSREAIAIDANAKGNAKTV